MQKAADKKTINRILDANINRAKEGLRVCEEITRFTLNNHRLTSCFKKIRHDLNIIVKKTFKAESLLESRRSLCDIGKNIYVNELKRSDTKDIFFANIQRAKESLRVLEEFSKLTTKENCAIQIKGLRYRLYEAEKKSAKKITSLFNC